MRLHPSFKSRLNTHTEDDVFDYFRETLIPRLVTSGYLVDWQKVKANTARIELALHLLDYLIGKPNLKKALFEVITSHPSVVDALPSVFASRDNTFALIPRQSGAYLQVEEYLFDSALIKTDNDISKIVKFCDVIGLLEFVRTSGITSFTDFTFGVETGLDSNGRKNRGGKQMEGIVEHLIKEICDRESYQYITQASAEKIMDSFGRKLTVDKSTRRIDFAINTTHKLVLIETNFYGGGGSKLKATAGEYKGLYDHIKKDRHEFIWITDGIGWHKALKPLREAFDHTDYILNLKMVSQDVLADLLLP